MKSNRINAGWLMLLALSTLSLQPATALAQGTAFTYQGKLTVGTNAANGLYDLQFVLNDALSGGNQIAGPLTNNATAVTNGLFTVALDFGPGVFTGPARWLELDVRTNGIGAFTPLLPLQQLLPMPYSIMANTASNLLGTLAATQLSGTVPMAELPAGVVTNGATGVTLTGTLGGNGAALTNLNGSAIQSGTIGSSQLASGVTGGVPSGAIVLSATASNAALSSAGFGLLVAPLGAGWTKQTSLDPWWAPRAFPGAAAFNGQVFVLGGELSSGYTNDVWSSSNGVAWTWCTGSAPWNARGAFGTVLFNNKLWVMGGMTNDVWATSDAATWTRMTSSAQWASRFGFAALTLNGQMWVLGGSTSHGITNDVCASSDGVNWTCVTNKAPWSNREYFGAAAFNGQLWVLGGISAGGIVNDIWCSSNGVAWTCVTTNAAWSPRDQHQTVVLNGQLWLMGGYGLCLGNPDLNYVWSPLNDVWSSSDGVNWICVTNNASWSNREGLGAVALNGQLWVIV